MPAGLSLSKHPYAVAVASALSPGGPCAMSKSVSLHLPRRLLVAVSGGADSVALLRCLHWLSQRRGWSLHLIVGHVQHHLRPEAEIEAQFVRDLAASLALPFERADLDLSIRSSSVERSSNLEARARVQRYQALHSMANRHDFPEIVVAHHSDDQLETLLMRLLRGSSVRGLSGMPWRRRLRGDGGISGASGGVRLLRPALATTHAMAIELLQAMEQTWHEDASNRDTSRLRAALRARVLPVLREIEPGVAKRAAELSDHMRQVAAVLGDEVDAAQRAMVHQPELRTTEFSRSRARRLPAVVLTQLLQKLLRSSGVPADALSRVTLSRLARAINDTTGGRRSFSLRRGVRVVVTREQVTIQSPASRA
jgi:tRNA(Ile)-lysidine synthase